MHKDINQIMENSVKQNRKFGLIVGLAFIVLAAYLFFRKTINPAILASIGIVLLLVAIVAPLKLTPVKEAWGKLGEILGKINTVILLTIVYCVILTPIGILIRLLGKDILKLKNKPDFNSYWEIRSTEEKGTFNQQF